MKKILFSLLCFIVIKAGAQDKIYGGIRLSPNFSIINDKAELYKKVKSGVGYSIGYFEVLELSYKINLQGEINYSNYSFKTDVSFDPTKTDNKMTNYQSLEIPLAVKFRPSEAIAFGVGYQFSFFATTKDEANYGTNPGSWNDEESSGNVRTNGFFFDINGKAGKSIFGLRIVKFNKNLIDTDKLYNFSAYVGIGLF